MWRLQCRSNTDRRRRAAAMGGRCRAGRPMRKCLIRVGLMRSGASTLGKASTPTGISLIGATIAVLASEWIICLLVRPSSPNFVTLGYNFWMAPDQLQ